MAFVIVIVAAAVAVGLIVVVFLRPSIVGSKWGNTIAVLAFLVLPAIALTTGFTRQFERSKTNEFCFGCHVMRPFRDSLYIDDTGYIPANHFQNKRISREKACYSSHADYAFFGDVKTKLRGLRHAFVYYFGKTPDVIEMYEHYSNGSCLRCHDGARSFQENPMHSSMLSQLRTDEMSCLDCHGQAHNTGELDNLPMWAESEEGE